MDEQQVSNSTTEESALIEQAQGGDLAAFDQLVLLHQQEVFAVALRMLGNRDEAQDVAQDAFVRAYRAIGKFRREAKLSTWLVSIAMNLCRNRRRWWARRNRLIAASIDEPLRTEDGSVGHDVVDPAPSPRHAAERREQRRQLMTMLQMLDETHRSVIVLRDIEGYSYEEIAHMLGCQIGTVKSRLSRARIQLRALLDGKL
jgi:RNA polymerase sigma-70 factor (ECF subfamily)